MTAKRKDWLGKWRKNPSTKSVLFAPSSESMRGWAVDVKVEKADGLRTALRSFLPNAESVDRAMEAALQDGEDGVVAAFTYSTARIDSYRDTVDPNGWEFEDFARNPVALFAHNAADLPVGKDVGVHVQPDVSLRGVIRFAPESLYPFGNTVGRMVLGEFLNAVSVGFAPTDYVFAEERESDFGMPAIDFKKQSLREISVVPVPANADALVDGRAASFIREAGFDLDPLVEWTERILDAQDKATFPRSFIEKIRAAAVGERIQIDGINLEKQEEGETMALKKKTARVPVKREPMPEDEKPVEVEIEVMPEEEPEEEEKAELTVAVCPACGYEGDAMEFAPAEEPAESDMEAAADLPTKALIDALTARGYSFASQDDDGDDDDLNTEEIARRAAEIAVREVNKAMTRNTGRLP